jgi:prevent-host-death family protein
MTWALQDAKARLSELMRRALVDGPQFVTVRGRPTLVVVSQAEFTAMNRRKRRKPLVELFRHSPIAGLKLDLTRSRDTGRRVDL